MLTPKSRPPLADTPPRLEYLDGVRGIAALYVVLHHVVAEAADLPGRLSLFNSFFAHGHDGVVVFIVLSGYCLMLPILGTPDGRLRGGFAGYLKRRAMRILPPYYASIAIALALVALVPAMGTPNGSRWDLALPAVDAGSILSHAALVHNLNWRYIYTINMPLWSVATEWQIYFAFPVLLMVRRRLGAVASVALGLLAGYAVIPLTFAIGREYLQTGCPWMLGAFALGMGAAEVSGSVGGPRPDWRERIPWRLVAACLAACLCLIRLSPSAGPLLDWYWTDLIIGLATSCLLVGCTLATRRGDRGLGALTLKLFLSRRAVALGGFSYSLYLIHQPVISSIHLVARRWDGPAYLAAMLVVATPLCLASGYLLYRATERVFMPRRAGTGRESWGGRFGGAGWMRPAARLRKTGPG